MRLHRLDLIRFGKFTDQSLSFPSGECDFHVIMGPNEAGKSTVRTAVHDLLYGIPVRTTHAFHHAMSELRLGAKLSHGDAELEFHRTKGQRNTLRHPTDAAMSDESLLPFLGSTDKEFFTQMFGLNHERLVSGGSSILSSSNDLGQILFQSATGIQSLGTLRQALEDEASKLWTKNKSGQRDYYIAAEELDKATTALKAATVRSKDWADAKALVTSLEDSQAAAKARHVEIRQRRSVLERIRRVAPTLEQLTQAQLDLAQLGDVALLPEGSAKVLSDAERAIALAQAEIDRQTQLRDTAKTSLAELTLDTAVREFADDITHLNENRLQFRAHEGDIQQRQAEVSAKWSLVIELAQSIGWPTGSEEEVRQQLPSPLTRLELTRLVQERPVLQGKLDAAERAEASKKEDIEQARADLARLTSVAAPVELQTALSRAQQLGNFEALTRELRQTTTRRIAAQEAAFAALGQWRRDEVSLRATAVPATQVIKTMVQEQLAEDLALKTAKARVVKLKQQIVAEELLIEQYRRTHTPVTRDEVLAARQSRAQTWAELKAEPSAMAQLATIFEEKVDSADGMADRSHDTVKQASELAAKQAQLERYSQELNDAEAEVTTQEEASAARTMRWTALSQQAGLTGLPVEAAETWLELRIQALTSVGAVEEATAQEQIHAEACNEALVALTQELVTLGHVGEGKTLATVVSLAQSLVSEMTSQQGERKTLEKQISDGERASEPLAAAVSRAKNKLDEWDTTWVKVLKQAGSAADTPLAQVEATLPAAERIETALSAIQSIRTDRIDTMRADLDGFNAAAQQLMQQVAPDLHSYSSEVIATKLVTRLDTANETHRQAIRLRESEQVAEQRLEEAVSNKLQAEAVLLPLLQRAGVLGPELPVAIEKSDLRRALQARSTEAEQALKAAGDALPLEHLKTEATSIELSALLRELEELTEKDEELVESQAGIATKLAAAKAALDAIGGTADAAKAEAQRQEAIAKMTDTVERYLKVYTGARLLKWSIERYREVKQGPMLLSASRIFANLTLGSFEKLSVDFDSDPVKLVGRRNDGKTVEISGMSEGTRDQLYLALRLAALELHLSQAHALPFIADDLFINYDDARSSAGLRALKNLSRTTQVFFLTHHQHLLSVIQEVFGADVNVQSLQ